MPKIKMRSKENILFTVHKLWGTEGSLNIKILTLEALLDIRDSLNQYLMIEDELIKRRIK
jgi:hypothetical protein